MKAGICVAFKSIYRQYGNALNNYRGIGLIVELENRGIGNSLLFNIHHLNSLFTFIFCLLPFALQFPYLCKKLLIVVKPKIWLSSPHMSGFEQQFVNEAFNTNWIAPLGPNVTGFEQELQQYTGSPHAAALSAGTAAIHMALILCGVQPGDLVICQSFTFSATANPIKYLGATPVFVDSERDTWNMDPETLEEAIVCCREGKVNGRPVLPKAILPVHLYGMPAKMDAIMAIAGKYAIPVIEDAAEALGSSLNGSKCGTFGKFGILSFNGNKIITTSGGGALLSEDGTLIEKARFLATQARDNAPHYQHSHIGYNYRMSNVVAGIGRGQLKVIDERVTARRANFERYRQYFANLERKGYYVQLQGLTDETRSEFSDETRSASGVQRSESYEPTKPASGIERSALAGLTRSESDVERSTAANLSSGVERSLVSNRWLTAIIIDPSKNKGLTREELRLAFEAENIESRPLWKPMHLQPVFADCPFFSSQRSGFSSQRSLFSTQHTGDSIQREASGIQSMDNGTIESGTPGEGLVTTNSVSEELFRNGLCLPSGSNLTEEDWGRIIGVMDMVFNSTSL